MSTLLKMVIALQNMNPLLLVGMIGGVLVLVAVIGNNWATAAEAPSERTPVEQSNSTYTPGLSETEAIEIVRSKLASTRWSYQLSRNSSLPPRRGNCILFFRDYSRFSATYAGDGLWTVEYEGRESSSFYWLVFDRLRTAAWSAPSARRFRYSDCVF